MEYENMTVSGWLEERFKHFDDLIVLFENGKVYVGDNILKDNINVINEAIRQLKRRGPSHKTEIGYVEALDKYNEELKELSHKLDSYVEERKSSRQRLFGIKVGRHALSVMEKYIGERRTEDRVLGYDIFLKIYGDECSCPRHQGFVKAVQRRADWERRVADRKILKRYNEVIGGLVV